MLVEVADQGNRLFYSANAKKGSRQPTPIKVPRPSGASGETEDVPSKKRPATSAELATFFAGKVRYTRGELASPESE